MWRIWIVKPNLPADVKNIIIIIIDIIIITKYIKLICIMLIVKIAISLQEICDIY